MKTITLIICAALSWNIHAEEQNESSEIETIVRAVEQTTGWTADELKAGLDRLDRLYQHDMKDKAGRVRWHGEIVKTEYDTNTLYKVMTHEDGFVHREKFTPVRVSPVTEQLSAEERKKKAEEVRKRRLEQLKANEIAKLQELMKKYPEELAKQKVEAEKAALSDPIVVNAVVTPQGN